MNHYLVIERLPQLPYDEHGLMWGVWQAKNSGLHSLLLCGQLFLVCLEVELPSGVHVLF